MKQLRCSCLCFLSVALLAHSAFARSFIRDAEVEDTLAHLTHPILAAAEIEPASVRLFIINDPSINAFVAGGQNIFFHTGLLMQAEDAAMLMGVIAHETGHISGAHLTQLAGATDEATLGAILSTILGAAAILAGSPQGGAAIMSGGQNTAMRNLLSHYRGNEQQADEAGVRYLRAVGLSPAGMLSMFELLRRNERQHFGGGGDPYLRTHPLTTDRIAALRAKLQATSDLPANPPAATQHRFERMQAKLFAFLSEPSATLSRYTESDRSEAGHLARAIAYFKQPDMPKAKQEVEALIALSPSAFSYDLKGQILFETAHIPEAINAYEQASLLAPENSMILTELGKAYLASEKADLLPKATASLERAAQHPNASAETHRQLAIAHGKLGNLGKSYLALAREAALSHKPEDVIRYAELAQKHISGNPALMLQSEDLIQDAKRVKKDEEKN